MEEAKHFIAGEWTLPAQLETIPVVDPSDGQPFATIARGTAPDIERAVAAARDAFAGAWGAASAAERGRVLMRLSARVADCLEELAAIEARDTGKPLKQARADAAALARYFEFYAGAADKLHGETLPYQAGYTVLTVREPHGVTGHIVPWNYPMQIFGRSVGAALAAGNACVVKPAEDACLSLLRVAELAAEAGLPAGALNIVTGYGHEAGAALARHPGIDHISFTGSPATGKLVTQMAAENHVPVTLELGGKSPQIVFADADLDAALPVLVSAIVQNGGQTCSAGSRVLIERAVYEPLVDRLATAFNALRVGPSRADLDCGPLINAKQQQRVWDFLSDAQHDGIPMAAHGQVVADAPESGFYQAPALLRDVPPSHRLAQEEVFGPVLAAMRFVDEEEAVALANGTPYGLVAGIWTRDGARQMRIARRLRAGQVFINNYGAGGGVELPFGGVGHSGHGREKGFEALYGFTALKTIAIRHG
ncbi:aldehyde dehydrogenase family protein [Burkholderia dolosa]|uniref:aldehyde dehydrogenase family protein n=1 Tax=Burkholderia dolosa TaxID=152500 RepID=UPI00158FA288|nr:aldehyde dehydrogenase family protein [Burkholderia dolosa]MBR8057977.1 aldehyde dehydrogenase family protein [Burkholderia dolosa]MBR8304580.1 aldehyde dehydrogenase family protein [Burkholderia dolosa]MBR8458139.1 aldehyde dehydrogenase family protein [Burkholderia dolosa]MBY4754921.1 aldehyde dehydrogenase family protein [Burkholderia dolosa]MBY4832159.1 aldehyde dehydrogenase family protein [Burkholderia dolosa]